MSTVTRAFSRPLALVLLVAAVAVGCDTAPGPSLYDPIKEGTYQPPNPDPALTGISPASGEALAGVTELTLTGQRFNPSADSTFVYFNGERQPVRSITPTEIRLRAPNMPKVAIDIKVSVLRAENFSETIGDYRLLPAVERVGALEVRQAALCRRHRPGLEAHLRLAAGHRHRRDRRRQPRAPLDQCAGVVQDGRHGLRR